MADLPGAWRPTPAADFTEAIRIALNRRDYARKAHLARPEDQAEADRQFHARAREALDKARAADRNTITALERRLSYAQAEVEQFRHALTEAHGALAMARGPQGSAA